VWPGAFGVLEAFTLTLGGDGQWRFNLDLDTVSGVADSGDPEVDIVELLTEGGHAANAHGEGVLLLLDEMHFLSKTDLGLLSKAMHQVSQEVLPVLIVGAGLPQLPLMLKEDKLYASVRRDGLLKKGLIYSRVDTQLDFTVPQFATFIHRIHPFDAAQRPRRGRPRRDSRS
jgi:hypothetical protein